MTRANCHPAGLFPEPKGTGLLSCKWGARGVVLLALIHLSILWIAHYDRFDLDDKAVHYYSAARLYAGRTHAEAIAKARPAWLSRLDIQRQFRLDNRLSSFSNYVIPSSLLRLMAQLDRPSAVLPPRSYTWPLKIAFFLLHVFGLVWIVAVTWRDPFVSVFLFTCLALASFRASLSWIAPVPPKDMVYLAYIPRGSAILLLMGVFAAFQQRRWLMAGMGCLLMFGWHFGTAALLVPPAVLAFGLTRAAQLRSRWTRFILAGVLLLLGGMITTAEMPPPFPTRLWIPLLMICLFMIAGRAPSQNPWLTAMALTAAYLFLTQTLITLFMNPWALDWLLATTGNMLVAELPVRLAGSRQVAVMVLLLATGVGLLNIVSSRWISIPWRKRAFLAAALILFVSALYAYRDEARRVVEGRCAFFRTEDARVVRQPLTRETLRELDPRDEPLFFASLGDFLLCPLVESTEE